MLALLDVFDLFVNKLAGLCRRGLALLFVLSSAFESFLFGHL